MESIENNKHMKKWIAIVLFLSAGVEARSQSNWWKEWFRQNKAQKEYLARQIVALQGYIQVARKGYGIAQQGLTAIGRIKEGDFNLHRDFFAALERVSPAIRHDARVGDIAAMQARIVDAYRRDMRGLRQSNTLGPEELAYVSRVYGRLLDDCARIAGELIALTTDSELKMSDDGRLRRIGVLYGEMKESLAFCRAFGDGAAILAAQRKLELREGEETRQRSGLEP